MQPYEIYLAIGGCDSEWVYLGTVQAASLADALKRARDQWTDYDPGELVAMEAIPMLVSS